MSADKTKKAGFGDAMDFVRSATDTPPTVLPPSARATAAVPIEAVFPSKRGEQARSLVGPEMPQAKPSASPEKVASVVSKREPLPWNSADRAGTVSATFRLPSKLFLQLQWLGGTTFKESNTSILIKALEVEVAKRLHERGIAP